MTKYEKLLNAWKREIENLQLQSLPEEFYVEMTEYISQLREQTGIVDKAALKGRITIKESDYAERMLEELSHLRLRKVVNSELDGQAIAGAILTREEKALNSELRTLLSSHQNRLKSILRGRVSQVDAKPPLRSGLKVVRFLEPVPALMGIDMKTYGPFHPEDVVSLPVENAENLIRRGIAKEVEIQQ